MTKLEIELDLVVLPWGSFWGIYSRSKKKYFSKELYSFQHATIVQCWLVSLSEKEIKELFG